MQKHHIFFLLAAALFVSIVVTPFLGKTNKDVLNLGDLESISCNKTVYSSKVFGEKAVFEIDSPVIRYEPKPGYIRLHIYLSYTPIKTVFRTSRLMQYIGFPKEISHWGSDYWGSPTPGGIVAIPPGETESPWWQYMLFVSLKGTAKWILLVILLSLGITSFERYKKRSAGTQS